MNQDIICKRNGVTFYLQQYLQTSFEVVDIDVEDYVQTVSFSDVCEESTVYSLAAVHLRNTTKKFPNVTQLDIGQNIQEIQIPNSLFPNVKRVQSKNNARFRDEVPVLLTLLLRRKSEHTKQWVLLNTFNQTSDSVIDLADVRAIAGEAFSGCLTTNIVNTSEVSKISDVAFKNYDMYTDKKTGAKIFGNILIDVCQDREEVEIPDDRYKISNVMQGVHFSECTKRVKIHRYETVKNILPMISALPEILIFDNTEENFSDSCLAFPDNIGNMKIKYINVNESNPMYKTMDGILYSKDGTVLLRCPYKRSGDVIIPEGVETITEEAFLFSNIESITFPDTLTRLEPYAFRSCTALKNVTFWYGLEYLPDGAFISCIALKHINIPKEIKTIGKSCFILSRMKEVIFHEGLVSIQDNAFNVTEDVTLPSSLQYIGKDNFVQAKRIYVKGKIPKGLLPAILEKAPPKDLLTEIHMGDKVLYVPHVKALPATMKLMPYIENLPYKHLKDIIENLFEEIDQTEQRQDTALLLYTKTKNKKALQYLQSEGIQIATRMAQEGRESDLLQLVKMQILHPDELPQLISITQEQQMPVATACILNQINDCRNDVSFLV